MQSKSIYIFYSWQSDTNQKVNNYFIKDALKKVIKQIKRSFDPVEEIQLDSDTKRVPGIPQVTNTILGKIERSSIFIPDLTFICSSEEGKKIPNPNVMLELGYALKSLGSERILTVINEAYGNCNELPFDLGFHRWPIKYNLTTEASHKEKKRAEEKLIEDLKFALSLTIKEGVLKIAKKEAHVRKIITEIQEELCFSKYCPKSISEQLERLYSEAEINAINGDFIDVETFINFIKRTYFPQLKKIDEIDGIKNQNHLAYWDRVFSKDGSLSKIKDKHNNSKITELIKDFRAEMSFSKYRPVESLEGYLHEFDRLTKKAVEGNLHDIYKFKEFLINDYIPFVAAYYGNVKTSNTYAKKWGKIFDKKGILTKLQDKYKFL